MAAEVDVRAISVFSSVPDASVTALLESPTTALVDSLLKGIAGKIKEFEQTKSQKVKLEVELETVVRTNESKTKVLQNSRDKALTESSKLRIELQTSGKPFHVPFIILGTDQIFAENTRARLEIELDQCRSATSNETSELNTLRTRISSLEAANRDTLSLLESKNTAYESLAQDLSAQHQRAAELRKQAVILEQSAQSANATVASAKFKEQSLQQELEMLKKTNEWLENERKIKADEHTNFRKEKNARISELSRSNEQNISEAETLRRSETTLKQRLEEHMTKFEETLEEMQKQREEKISSEDSFRVELESVNRLAELQAASAETAKQRVRELSAALEEAREEAANEIGTIRAEIETEHSDRLAAEERVAELENSLQQMSTELEEAKARPSTPQRATNGSGITTPLRPGTPSGIFSPAILARGKSQMTMTQLFSEYKKLEGELASEKRAREQMQENLDAMVDELENNKPEIEELREDHARLQSEVVEMSKIVDKANQDRDVSVKELRNCQGQLEVKSREAEILSQQLRDKGSEIRYLLVEQFVREQGEALSREDFEDLEQKTQAALSEDMANLSEGQQLINHRLVVFKNITELQQQNENQLKTIRNLISELERNEAQQHEQQNYNLNQELEQARSQIANYQEELRSMVAQTKTFIKERDMFRNMLTRRGGQIPGHVQPNDFSRSLPVPSGESPADSVIGGEVDYAKLLRDVQQHFDSYRQEVSTDHSALKHQVDELSRKNSQLQTEISRTAGQLTAANQRYEMLQANYNSLKTENGEIQKRSWTAMENATKQELKTQQVAEELVEARSLLDSLRRDSANLKAEKDLWKSVEHRLIEDNESIRNERSRLDQLNAGLQSMINQREHSEAETRRRLQSNAEALESELQSAKRKLNDEIEENKKATLRREYDQEQSQKRIDDLVTGLSATKEELASAKTAREHLQARVDELTVELRSAEERVEVLTKPAEPAAGGEGTQETTLDKEQELALEVSELKRDLELKISELERANEQVEVYKNISQSSEERLQELSETNDQYREETEALLSEKDAKIKDLQQRADDISSELETTNQELSRLRDEQAEFDRRLDEQKSSLDSEIERLKQEAEKSAEQAQFNLEASKIQAQIATEAQQNYENELVKHADAAKSLHTVRDEANKIKLEMVDIRTQAESSRGDLERRQASWDEMKTRYEKELADSKKRREELAHQNDLLHKQLESVMQQITALQRDRTALAETSNDASATQPSAELEKLQEVITFIRQDKDIVDLQRHLAVQEGNRLRQQLQFAQSQLDETRLKLDQQRRTEADAERNALSHNKLMDTLNELNLFRESSVTLRAEAKQANQALVEKSRRVEQVEEEIQSSRARVAELENLLELKEGELKLSQEDRDHWQQRTQNILSKYDRVDPAELEALKEKITTLETERDETRTQLDKAVTERGEAQTALQAQIDVLQTTVDTAKLEQKTRLETQFKGMMKEKNSALRERVAERDALQTELNSLKEQLSTLQAQVDSTAATQMNGEKPNEPTASGTTDVPGPEVVELEAKIEELQQNLADKTKQFDELASGQDEKYKSRVAANESVLNKRLAEFKQQAQQAKALALEELTTTLTAQHQQELEALRSQSTPAVSEVQKPNGDVPNVTPLVANGEIPDDVLLALSEEKAKLLTREHPTIRRILTNTIKNRLEKEKDAIRESVKQELSATQNSTTNEAAEESIKKPDDRFDVEKEAIIKQKEAEFEVEKQALIKQHEGDLQRERELLANRHQEELQSQKLQFDADAAKKIEEQVKNAELLADKRGALKVNMAQNRLAVANAKLEVVSKASDETPDKPVKEVWEIAKNTKAPTAPKPAATVTTAKPEVNGSVEGTAPPPAADLNQPNTVEAAPQPSKPNPLQPPASQPVSFQPAPSESTAPDATKPSQQSGAALMNQLQSGIPRGGSMRGRGSGIPRGRGGAPRGARGGQTAPSGNTHQPGRGAVPPSPAVGNLNPQAAQFNPGNGNKRAREDGEITEVGGQGKRIRGEGAAAA